MPAPQPVEVTKVSSLPPAGKQAAPFLSGISGEIGDQIFKFAMLLCGLAVLATLVLIVYELVLRSALPGTLLGSSSSPGMIGIR